MDLKIPSHIAILLDGNRRWAKERGLPSMMGHKAGADNIDVVINKARDMGVKCVSAWIFSTENWKRDRAEVDYIFDLARQVISKYKKKALDEHIRFVHVGRKDRLPEDILKELIEVEEQTKDYDAFTLALCADYGGHDELARAMNKVVEEGLEITEENIENHLDTHLLPQLDLIIRTGGEIRLSGFMSWQCAYAELYFTPTYFPDFDAAALEKAIEDFSLRDRRYGGDSVKAS